MAIIQEWAHTLRWVFILQLNSSRPGLYTPVLILSSLILNSMNGASRIYGQWNRWVIESLKNMHEEPKSEIAFRLLLCCHIPPFHSVCVWMQLCFFAGGNCDQEPRVDVQKSKLAPVLASLSSLFWFSAHFYHQISSNKSTGHLRQS